MKVLDSMVQRFKDEIRPCDMLLLKPMFKGLDL